MNAAYEPDYAFFCTGAAGVEFKMNENQSVNLGHGCSTTRGPLIVSGGTLRFTALSDACKGEWHGHGSVCIADGAKIVTSYPDVFGSATDGYRVQLEMASSASLELGADQRVRCFTYGDVAQPVGTYGRIGSGADHEMACFSGDGILTVEQDAPLGTFFFVK